MSTGRHIDWSPVADASAAPDGSWPGPAALPLARADEPAVALDDDVALYDEVGRVLIMLNPSAAAVWARCDGATSFDEIVRELARDHGVAGDEIRGDVRRTVRKLADLGLVTDAR